MNKIMNPLFELEIDINGSPPDSEGVSRRRRLASKYKEREDEWLKYGNIISAVFFKAASMLDKHISPKIIQARRHFIDCKKRYEEHFPKEYSDYEQVSFGAHCHRERHQEKINNSLKIARQYSDCESSREWVIDRMVRSLTEGKYEEWVSETKAGNDGPNTYRWDTGIRPPKSLMRKGRM